jgi:alkyl sulfatase BDS1-like metallo-beta-lactamase superfamily hydrolase
VPRLAALMTPKRICPNAISSRTTIGPSAGWHGIRLDSATAGDAAWTINLVTPDNGERFVIELSNGTLTNLQGFLAESPDLTITFATAPLDQAYC